MRELDGPFVNIATLCQRVEQTSDGSLLFETLQRIIAAQALGVRLQVVEAQAPTDIDRAFSDMTRARAGALTGLSGSMFFNERRRLVDLAAKHRLPAVYPLREFVDAEGLMDRTLGIRLRAPRPTSTRS